MHCRTRHTARAVCQRKASSVNINLHSCDRIDHGECIRTARFRCTRHLRDVGDIRGKLHDDRLLCMAFHLFCDFFDHLRILSERNTALLYIRAGNIDLEQIYRLVGEAFHHINVFLRRMSADIDDDLRVIFFEKRNVSVNEQINARIL